MRLTFCWIRLVGIFIGILGALTAGACAPVAPSAPTRLTSPIDESSVALVETAIARGEQLIDVGDWSRPAHVSFVSGGNAASGRKIAELMKLNGMTARCVGFCGSALAEILLGASNCIVTPGALVMPHLAQAVGGTARQNSTSEVETVAWWFMNGGGAPARAALVQNLVASPTRAWLMRDGELRAAGCQL